MEIKDIPTEQIEVGEYAQRVELQSEALDELIVSVRRVGILVPLVVVTAGDSYTLVAGHRRLAAAIQIGLSVVPCIVRAADDAVVEEVAFAENFFRQDLSAVELAAAIKDCLDQHKLTADELAKGLHRTVYWVQAQAALTAWPDDVLEAIHNGKLSVSAGSNLALITEDVYRDFLLRQAVENGATARATAAWLQAWQSMAPAEEAITREPVAAGRSQLPAVPQAPCIVCSNVYRTDELSHVPVCCHCIRTIRTIGDTG